jgi:hypothetical protein
LPPSFAALIGATLCFLAAGASCFLQAHPVNVQERRAFGVLYLVVAGGLLMRRVSVKPWAASWQPRISGTGCGIVIAGLALSAMGFLWSLAKEWGENSGVDWNPGTFVLILGTLLGAMGGVVTAMRSSPHWTRNSQTPFSHRSSNRTMGAVVVEGIDFAAILLGFLGALVLGVAALVAAGYLIAGRARTATSVFASGLLAATVTAALAVSSFFGGLNSTWGYNEYHGSLGAPMTLLVALILLQNPQRLQARADRSTSTEKNIVDIVNYSGRTMGYCWAGRDFGLSWHDGLSRGQPAEPRVRPPGVSSLLIVTIWSGW